MDLVDFSPPSSLGGEREMLSVSFPILLSPSLLFGDAVSLPPSIVQSPGEQVQHRGEHVM